MRIRSWMTAWVVVASVSSLAARAGDDEPIVDAATPTGSGTVKLEIQITGLGAEGAKVAIKPAHPGCRFRAVEANIKKGSQSDVTKLKPISVVASTTSADRDCSFEITLTEPGRPARTFRRGLQLPAADAKDDKATTATAAKATPLKCYLSVTEVAAREDSATKKR